MPTTLFSWEPIVECSVARYYLESQPRYSADYQLVNIEAISACHEAQHEHGFNNYNNKNTPIADRASLSGDTKC